MWPAPGQSCVSAKQKAQESFTATLINTCTNGKQATESRYLWMVKTVLLEQKHTLASCWLSGSTFVFWVRQTQGHNVMWEWVYITPLKGSLCCANHQQSSFPHLTLYRKMHSLLHKHKLTWRSRVPVINFFCCELFYISTSMRQCEDSFRMKTPTGSVLETQT